MRGIRTALYGCCCCCCCCCGGGGGGGGGCRGCCGGSGGGGADCSLTKTSYFLPSEPSMERSARSVDASLSRAAWVAGGSAAGGLGAACAAAAAPSTAAVGGRFLCLTPARQPRRVRLRPCCCCCCCCCCSCCCSAPGAGRAAPAAGRSGGRARLRLGAAAAVSLALAAKAAWARKRAAGLDCGGCCCGGGGGCCCSSGGCCSGGGGCCGGGGSRGITARVTSSKSPSRSRAFGLLSKTAEPRRDTAGAGAPATRRPEFSSVCRTVSPCSRHHVVESGAAVVGLRRHT